MKSCFNTQKEEFAIVSPLSFMCNMRHINVIPDSGYCEKKMHSIIFFIFFFTNTMKSHVASNFFFCSGFFPHKIATSLSVSTTNEEISMDINLSTD